MPDVQKVSRKTVSLRQRIPALMSNAHFLELFEIDLHDIDIRDAELRFNLVGLEAPPELIQACAEYSAAVRRYEDLVRSGECPSGFLMEGAAMHAGQEFLALYGFPKPRTPEELFFRYQISRGKGGTYKKQPIPVALRWEVFARDNFTCRECGSRKFLTADHVIPESKQGPTTLENLQTLCQSCNSRKGNR